MFNQAVLMRCVQNCTNALRQHAMRRRFSTAIMQFPNRNNTVLRSRGSPMTVNSQTRSLFSFLNHAWNRPDEDRVKEVGPDRACAEWVLRCSGSVRFDGRESWTGNYNALSTAGTQVHVVAMDFTDACVNDEGFDNLLNLKHVRSIKLHKNHDVSDTALYKLSYVKDSLESLQITACSNISSAGIESLAGLPNLRELFLANLPRVKDLKATVDTLKQKMPQCEIKVKDANDAEDSNKDAEHAANFHPKRRTLSLRKQIYLCIRKGDELSLPNQAVTYVSERKAGNSERIIIRQPPSITRNMTLTFNT